MDPDPLLRRSAALSGIVNYRGRTVSRSESGRWSAALFIIGAELAERFGYYGASLNLITYLTGPLQESTVTAASAINAWSGVSLMLPLLGAFIADSYLGRYRMITAASILYILGLGMLTLSAVLPALRPPKCIDTVDLAACSPSRFQVSFFYLSLYLVALAQGFLPCVQALGADQFDENDPEESASRSSFFNWLYFFMCGGIVCSIIIMTYIQDNVGWGLGFGIPCVALGIALVMFLLGTNTYRFYPLKDESPFSRIGTAFVDMFKSWRASDQRHPSTSNGEAGEAFYQSRIPDEGGEDHSVLRVEEAKGLLRLFPIWATCLIYGVVFAQSSTFFTKQGSTMDRRIGPSLQVPPAALQCLISCTIVAFIPIYDRALVPMARKFSGLSSGITMLQRIGTGMFISAIAMAVAALVETRRLKTARDLGLVDSPESTVPMTLWWLVPQYVLYGISESFTIVGFQEFFYDQMPDALRSLGLALFLSILGIGSFISIFLISVIDEATGRKGDSWFSNNINRAHLDYFYWLLAALSAVELAIFVYFSKSYVYKKKYNRSG